MVYLELLGSFRWHSRLIRSFWWNLNYLFQLQDYLLDGNKYTLLLCYFNVYRCISCFIWLIDCYCYSKFLLKWHHIQYWILVKLIMKTKMCRGFFFCYMCFYIRNSGLRYIISHRKSLNRLVLLPLFYFSCKYIHILSYIYIAVYRWLITRNSRFRCHTDKHIIIMEDYKSKYIIYIKIYIMHNYFKFNDLIWCYIVSEISNTLKNCLL